MCCLWVQWTVITVCKSSLTLELKLFPCQFLFVLFVCFYPELFDEKGTGMKDLCSSKEVLSKKSFFSIFAKDQGIKPLQHQTAFKNILSFGDTCLKINIVTIFPPPNSVSRSIPPFLTHNHHQLDHSTSQFPHNDSVFLDSLNCSSNRRVQRLQGNSAGVWLWVGGESWNKSDDDKISTLSAPE